MIVVGSIGARIQMFSPPLWQATVLIFSVTVVVVVVVARTAHGHGLAGFRVV